MSKKREMQDLAIRMGISGDEDPDNPGVQIVNDYLKREEEENLREQGFSVEMEIFDRTDYEKAMWKNDKLVEQLHSERWEKYLESKDAHLEREYNEDWMEIVLSKRVIKL